MANIHIKCKKCGSSQMNVRTSVQESANTVKSVVFCTSCYTSHEVLSEIMRVKIANFEESVEALRAEKPLNLIDPNQGNLPL